MIDVRAFKHRPSPAVLEWRDEVIVGKCNKAGVRKLVWVWPMKDRGPQRGPPNRRSFIDSPSLNR
jgi:hypothetical protein